MSEQQAEYSAEAEEALLMLGAGYEHPSFEIEAPRRVYERRNGKTEEVERPAFVKISTGFKAEMKSIDPTALKVWLYIALSINRKTNTAWPGLRKIAADTDLAINTVRDAVERLENQYGLLMVVREGTKKTIYEPVDYVSANPAKTVSKNDTLEQTVSVSRETVSTSDKTVSVRREKNAQPENQMNQTTLEWKISHNQPITPDDLNTEQKQATDCFERSLGFGVLPWSSSAVWQRLERFVLKVYKDNPRVFAEFQEWRENGKGKYKGWTNGKIRQNPQVFIDSALPEFEASRMYDAIAQPAAAIPNFTGYVDPNEKKYVPNPNTRRPVTG